MYYTDRFILTPGPTEIPERIRFALARKPTNPDLDPEFLELYNDVRYKIKRLLNAFRSDVYVMLGEAMLGLEASMANLIAKGEKVLVIANGVFGEGFADLVKMYGGIPIILEADWRRSVDVSEVERALEKNKDISAVTLVHCDTPSALLNNINEVAKIVKEFGALLIVDAVSSMGGVEIDVDKYGIDILLGGSQKVLNLPPGLTIITISKDAWEKIERVNYHGFYLNIKLWKDMLDSKGIFPYTLSDSLIYALNESLNMLFEEGLENVYRRHRLAQHASWAAAEALGLKLYPASISDSSPTVTAIEAPSGINEVKLREIAWKKYGVMIAGSWGRLQGKVIRIGHMGIQASRTHLIIAYTALAASLKSLGLEVNVSKAIEAIESIYK
ncbi:MAG: alanine--glyoxylate aminotransferase family protein [Staphylothermus sp.]|nr:alanine--glyoxylate aminotransferase family protein [Staphylothermus sp.]